MKKIVVISLLFFFFGPLQAQEEELEEFKPSGKVFVKVFTNFNSTVTDGDVHNSFDVARAYLGYSYKMSKTFSGKVTLDVGDPKTGSAYAKTAYLKNAYIQYKAEKLSVAFGLIGLHQFKLQEKQWGGRYMYKSFQDQHKFGNSADFAIHANYKIHDMLSIDATIANGEGYKQLESDSVFKYSAGLTISPVKGLSIRAYYDLLGDTVVQETFSFYVGYSTDKIKLGAEYNMQMSNKELEGQDYSGFSVYASYKLEKARLFGRFDQVSSLTLEGATDPWNYGKDGQVMIAGVEFSPVKGLKIAPNYQGWTPADGSATVHGAFLSCEIKF